MVVDGEGAVRTVDLQSDSDSDNSDTVSTCYGGDDDKVPDPSLALAVANANDNKPSFGNIAVNNSSDIHFGNKAFYNGPVTIKQFVYSTSVEENITNSPSFAIEQQQTVQKLNGNLSSEQNGVESSGPGRPWMSRHVLLLAVIVSAALVLITITTVMLTRDRQSKGVSTHHPTSEINSRFNRSELDVNDNGTLVIISRQVWRALPSKDAYTLLKLPVPYVIISHSASDQCMEVSLCVELVKNFQEFHMNGRKWDDIGYNFLVGGDGFAYEGRGWDYVGAHAYGYNNRSIGLSFIGTFTSVLPPKRQILAAKQLIEKGVELGKIDSNYKLLAHAQVSSTQSPGQRLFEELKTWSHWSETP